MCGIAGIFDCRGERSIDRSILVAMTDSIAHRGPDGSGHYDAPGVALGHRRLSIIDLGGGAQPMHDEAAGTVVTFNGEIYNFRELRHELEAKGARFATRSDTEVLLAAYRQWGEDCVAHLRGMFAFAIWDAPRQKLFLARDRLGKKPLYYAMLTGGLFVFASEMKAILTHPAVPRVLDPQAVEDYFALGYVPDPKTILSAVRKLAPGHVLTLARDGAALAPRRYWDLRFDKTVPGTPADLAEELVARLREAVRLRLIADVPLGAFLSGGVDSSAVVAMMTELSDMPVNTCAIGFDHPEFDETEEARRVARLFRADHRERQVAVEDFALLETLAGVYDEPFADASALPTYRVCELAREQVTVALSGDGGDEVFAGYRRHRLHMAEERVRRLLPLGLRAPLFGLMGRLYPKLDWAPQALRAKSTFQGLARASAEAYFNSVAITLADERRRLFSAAFRVSLQGYGAEEVMRAAMRDAPAQDGLSLIQYADIKTNLPGGILVKVDRASMAHGLEVRAPLLDHAFVEWAASIPAALRLNGGEGKLLFKQAMQRFLPDDVLYRRKMGFAVPISAWFRGPLRGRIAQALQSPQLRDTGYFDGVALAAMLKEHVEGRRDHGRTLWSLLMFEASLRRLFTACESAVA
ncbi:MAG: XrtA/PEP-CTERM system amidotransferase [Pseudomonadota bacterium]